MAKLDTAGIDIGHVLHWVLTAPLSGEALRQYLLQTGWIQQYYQSSRLLYFSHPRYDRRQIYFPEIAGDLDLHQEDLGSVVEKLATIEGRAPVLVRADVLKLACSTAEATRL